MDALTIISLVTGIASIVLAIVAMVSAKVSEKTSQANFEKTQEMLRKNYDETQKMMLDVYDKTKNALSQIDKKAEIIENVVQRNQEQLITTMTNLLNETIIPKKPDLSEQLGAQFLQGLMQNPTQMGNSMNELLKLSEAIEKQKKNNQ